MSNELDEATLEALPSEYQTPSDNRIWYDYGNEYRLKERAVLIEKLENAVYSISQDRFGFYLEKEHDRFDFDYKIYGLETDLINRVIRTYERTGTGNLGVLLNGLKGTGKSVTAKIIANKLNQPVILIAKPLKEIQGCHLFINSIPQNVTVFIDEYEKTFGQSSDMLVIMDGALNSSYRRVFLMTTNDLRVDTNLLERPSRIRYLKKFVDLSPEIVAEIVEDLLEHKQFKKECVRFISNLENITVDIVKAVVNEVNIHAEPPEVFGSIFNVKKLKGKFNIKVEDEHGNLQPFLKNVVVSQRPNFYENHIGQYFTVNDEYLGRIADIITRDTIEIEPLDYDPEDKDDNGKSPEDNRTLKESIIIKVEEAEMAHYSYTYGYGNGEGTGDMKKRTPKPTSASHKASLAEIADVVGSKKTALRHDFEE